jgi:hypothetical protein
VEGRERPVDLRENPRTLHMLGILRDQQDTKPQVIPRHVSCTGFRQIPRLHHDRPWDAITNAISFSLQVQVPPYPTIRFVGLVDTKFGKLRTGMHLAKLHLNPGTPQQAKRGVEKQADANTPQHQLQSRGSGFLYSSSNNISKQALEISGAVNNPQDKNLFLLKSIKNEMLGKSCDRRTPHIPQFLCSKAARRPRTGIRPNAK